MYVIFGIDLGCEGQLILWKMGADSEGCIMFGSRKGAGNGAASSGEI